MPSRKHKSTVVAGRAGVAQPFQFSPATFAYFDQVRKHANDKEWFESQRQIYADHVEVPLTHLIVELSRTLTPLLPGVAISPRKIAKPLLRRAKDSEGPALRTNATAFFSEPASSMFEQNPGIYLSVGAGEDDNVIGCGLYMVSSRQTKALRPACLADHARLDAIFKDRTLRKHWSGLTGDRYVRFPKEFDETAPGAKYLWQKRWLLSRHLTRAEVTAPSFIPDAIAALRAAVPFLSWTRETVGVYKKPAGGYGRERED